MSTITKQGVTAEEFEVFESETRLDLIKGELYPMPPMPGEEHGALTYDLAFELGAFIRANDLGQCYAAETRFIIERDPDTAMRIRRVTAHYLPLFFGQAVGIEQNAVGNARIAHVMQRAAPDL